MVFGLSSVALTLYTQGSAAPVDVVVVIPQGSGEAIAQGESVIAVPPVWVFNTGDTLTLDNRDSIDYALGDLVVDANDTLVIDMDVPSQRELLTNLLPTGVVTVTIEPSSFSFSIIAFPTFAFGTSVGIILYVGFSIARAMGHSDDEDWADA